MPKMSKVYTMLCELFYQRGERNIKNSPGLFRARIDARWSATCNPHPTEKAGIPPWHISVEYNQFPAGIIGPYGGIIAAGDVANENSLIAAVGEAIVKEKGGTK